MNSIPYPSTALSPYGRVSISVMFVSFWVVRLFCGNFLQNWPVESTTATIAHSRMWPYVVVIRDLCCVYMRLVSSYLLAFMFKMREV